MSEMEFTLDVAAKVAAVVSVPLMVALSSDGRKFVRESIKNLSTMNTQELLGRFGLTIDDLNSAERAQLMRWLEDLRAKDIQLPDVKNYVEGLISALERELAGLQKPETFFQYWFGRKRDTYLKARLINLLMLREFLAGPEKAQAFVEQQLRNLKAS